MEQQKNVAKSNESYILLLRVDDGVWVCGFPGEDAAPGQRGGKPPMKCSIARKIVADQVKPFMPTLNGSQWEITKAQSSLCITTNTVNKM